MISETLENFDPGQILYERPRLEFVRLPHPELSYRRGFFVVKRELMREHIDAIAPIMAHMVVTDVVHNFSNGTTTYFCFSELFERIDDYIEAPEYQVIFRKSPSGLNIEINKMPRLKHEGDL
jgi:hypothetical protein